MIIACIILAGHLIQALSRLVCRYSRARVLRLLNFNTHKLFVRSLFCQRRNLSPLLLVFIREFHCTYANKASETSFYRYTVYCFRYVLKQISSNSQSWLWILFLNSKIITNKVWWLYLKLFLNIFCTLITKLISLLLQEYTNVVMKNGEKHLCL